MMTTVPQPWTPVEVSQPSDKSFIVSVWGREIHFERGPLPTRIRVGNEDILAGPVRLQGAIDKTKLKNPGDAQMEWTSTPVGVTAEGDVSGKAGGKVETGWGWSETNLALWEHEPDHATLVGVLLNPVLTLNAVVRIEYDGFIRFDVTLFRNQPALDYLWFEAPIKSEWATLRHYWPGLKDIWPMTEGSVLSSGAVPGDGLALPFQPIVWVGNERGGLSWCAESDELWRPSDKSRALEILPMGDRTVFRARFYDEPMDAGAKTFSFGLQPTPVKPWSSRLHELNQCVNAFMGHVGYIGEVYDLKDSDLDRLRDCGARTVYIWNEWTPVLGYWRTSRDREEALKEFVKRCHDRGMRVMPYFGEYISTLAPEFPAMGKRMTSDISGLSGAPYAYNTRFPGSIIFTNIADDEWREIYLKGLIDCVERYGFDGVYLDGHIMPRGSTNPGSGLGYVNRDGNRRPTYPVFASRQFHRRLYEALHPLGKHIDVHNSSYCGTVNMAFAHSYWDGEQFGWGTNPDDLLKDPMRSFPLDSFRAEFMGRNFGIPCEFLEYDPGMVKIKMGITMLHDVRIRPTNPLTLQYMAPIWKAMSDFGTAVASWHPYWNNSRLVSVNSEDVKISFYRRTVDGRTSLLAVVTNFCSEAREIEVAFGEEAIRSIAAARDPLSGEESSTSGLAVRVALQGSGWKMLRIEQDGCAEQR